MHSVTPTPSVLPANSSSEMLLNPSFTADTKKWMLWTDTGGNAVGVGDEVYYDSAPASYKITCNEIGTGFWSIQFFTAGINLQARKTYELSFCSKEYHTFYYT